MIVFFFSSFIICKFNYFIQCHLNASIIPLAHPRLHSFTVVVQIRSKLMCGLIYIFIDVTKVKHLWYTNVKVGKTKVVLVAQMSGNDALQMFGCSSF